MLLAGYVADAKVVSIIVGENGGIVRMGMEN